jgi:hypothetical protein
MHMESVTVRCPQCGASSQLTLFETTNDQGRLTRQELEFACPGGHDYPEPVLIDLWSRARATTGR